MAVIFDQMVIIGVGLIGGSLGMAVRKHGLADKVVGIDLDENSLQMAKELGAVDTYALDYSPVRDADLVVLAAPIFSNLKILENIRGYLAPQAVVTDVGSTKSEFVAQAEQLLPNNAFVGGHPMAGAETAGVGGADPYLFENAFYLLTPTETTDPQALGRVRNLVEGVGARALVLDPDTHDKITAAISHLPHLAAAALVQTAAELAGEHPMTLALAAGGFKDTTRVASGNPGLWKDICFSNKEQVIAMIDRFTNCLNEMKRALAEELRPDFEMQLAAAKTVRDQIPAKMKGYWPFLDEIIVTIPDRPGMIGQVAAILGGQDVNIDDIEILRVREGEGGTLRLGFAKIGSAEKAVRILKEHGFPVRVRNAH
ncbi:MAG: prephenate dehydrogenase [Candidatus Wallacebacter cryptica]